jgi:hypothetical protein
VRYLCRKCSTRTIERHPTALENYEEMCRFFKTSPTLDDEVRNCQKCGDTTIHEVLAKIAECKWRP